MRQIGDGAAAVAPCPMRRYEAVAACPMQFDALTFQQKILIDGFNGLGTVVLSLISENPRSRFMLELELLLCLFRVLKRVARSLLF